MLSSKTDWQKWTLFSSISVNQDELIPSLQLGVTWPNLGNGPQYQEIVRGPQTWPEKMNKGRFRAITKQGQCEVLRQGKRAHGKLSFQWEFTGCQRSKHSLSQFGCYFKKLCLPSQGTKIRTQCPDCAHLVNMTPLILPKGSSFHVKFHRDTYENNLKEPNPYYVIYLFLFIFTYSIPLKL